jgi:ABC-type Fe3+-hydroxamate transport system substrate-binding protein/adenosylcobinamide amidohydrolase
MSRTGLKPALLLLLLLAPALVCAPARGAAVSVVDHRGTLVRIPQPPQRVVSLVPAVTEMIVAIGAGGSLAAVTANDSRLPEMAAKPVIGGFHTASLERIAALAPDLIFYAAAQTGVPARFAGGNCRLVNLEPTTLADGCETLAILGEIFDRRDAARAVCARNRAQLALMARKVATIAPAARLRVACLLGPTPIRAPGDDAFQNGMIRAAGGIPPSLGRNGPRTGISEAEWRAFDPQVVYGCSDDRRAIEGQLERPGWRAVEAVQKGRVYFFPRDLACRNATRSGEFVSWLAARMYRAAFARKDHQVMTDAVVGARDLKLGLDYVRSAQIVYSRIHDFENKTLLVDFTRPLRVLSTLEGPREGLMTVANHFIPPAGWELEHASDLAALRAGIAPLLHRPAESTSFLFTGADMDHLAVQHARFREMQIQALVTAGVCANALRAAKDPGGFYEPGTINIILLPNMALTPRAMARAVISATEAKTAALQDLDIRSSVNPGRHGATGTGTDNVIVVQGAGGRIDNAGGHSKMGELIAAAVYRGVQKAVGRQNGLRPGRDIFQRLAERRLGPYDLAGSAAGPGGLDFDRILAALEEVLLSPQHAAFVSAALAISDAHEAGRVPDLGAFQQWCRQTAEEIAGERIDSMAALVSDPEIPTVLRLCANALLNGVVQGLPNRRAPGR